MPVNERSQVSSSRVEAFSDAVFAITITFLVLEIKRPPFGASHLGRHLLDAWPQYVAFVVSFVYVGVLWLNHHALFARIRRVDLTLNWINLFVLGTSAAWVPVFEHLGRHPELLEHAEDRELLVAQRSRPLVGMVSYAAAGVLGWLVSPFVAVGLFIWMIVYHAITSEGLQANRLARSLIPTGRARATIADRDPPAGG